MILKNYTDADDNETRTLILKHDLRSAVVYLYEHPFV